MRLEIQKKIRDHYGLDKEVTLQPDNDDQEQFELID